MRHRRRHARAEPSVDRTGDEAATFDRWLADGLAPDDGDRAAGRMLADAWRDRRRALDGAAGLPHLASERRRLARWWAPVAAVAIASIAAVAVVSWPTPIGVDEVALAGAYLEAMGTLPMGAP